MKKILSTLAMLGAALLIVGCVADVLPPADLLFEDLTGDYRLEGDDGVTLRSEYQTGSDTRGDLPAEVANPYDVLTTATSLSVNYDAAAAEVEVGIGEGGLTILEDDLTIGTFFDSESRERFVSSLSFDLQISPTDGFELSNGCEMIITENLSMSFRLGGFFAIIGRDMVLNDIAGAGDSVVTCSEALAVIEAEVRRVEVLPDNELFFMFVNNDALTVGRLPSLSALVIEYGFAGLKDGYRLTEDGNIGSTSSALTSPIRLTGELAHISIQRVESLRPMAEQMKRLYEQGIARR